MMLFGIVIFSVSDLGISLNPHWEHMVLEVMWMHYLLAVMLYFHLVYGIIYECL